ncbi:MAG: beta-galactosidase, partial [Bryobacteraceae bacterium]
MDRRTFGKLAGLVSLGALMEGETPLETDSSSAEKANSPWNGYMLGAAYYPEWWKPSEWETDFHQMQELGINTVRMGEFAWACFEPAPGQFDFGWMDRAIALANHDGIKVILGTPTA